MRRLQLEQLPEHLVVLGIRDRRRVQDVIAVAMRLDVAPKRLSALPRLLRDRHQEKSRSASVPPGAMPRASILPCTAWSCAPIASKAAGPTGSRLSSTMRAFSSRANICADCRNRVNAPYGARGTSSSSVTPRVERALKPSTFRGVGSKLASAQMVRPASSGRRSEENKSELQSLMYL